MKKGITLATVVVMVAIISIITSTIVVYSMSAIETMNKQNFVTEYISLQNSVADYYHANGAFPIDDSITIQISNEYLEQFTQENLNNNKITLYKINYSTLGFDNLKYGNEESATDLYVISIDTGVIYYLKGIEYKGDVYYKVTKELEPNYDFELNMKNTVQVEDVYFTLNETKYTNQPIKVDIKLRTTCSYVDVTAKSYPLSDNTLSVSNESKTGGYKTIQVNTGEYIGNYTIVVRYNDESGTLKQASYIVNNSDSAIDKIEYGSVTTNIDGENILNSISVADYDSGIKTLKYEFAGVLSSFSEQEVINYFKNYGNTLEVYQTSINIGSNTSCIIYVEDKAGNYELVTISK